MIKRVREQSGILDQVQPAVSLLETDIVNFAREPPSKLCLLRTANQFIISLVMIKLNMSCREEKSQLKGNFLRQGGRPLVQHLCRRLRSGVPHPQRERPLN